MIAKNVIYTDFEGTSRNESFYFNLTEAELFELQIGTPGGIVNYLKKIAERQNGVAMMKFAKDFILKSYGEKTPDGRGFMKNEDIRANFEATNAFSSLFVKFVTDADWAVEFLLGVIPSDIAAKAREEMAKKAESSQSIEVLKTE